MRLKNINGYYNPSFFNIVLETNEEISLATKKYTATFMHEFIHYLQDLILPYNIRINFTNLSKYLKIRGFAKEHGYIKCPFCEWDNNETVLEQQFNYTFGVNPLNIAFIDDVQSIDSIQCLETEVISIEKRKFKLQRYHLLINGNKSHYVLGARDLLEYIAYKIESKHYETAELPQLPYRTIDLLFEYYGLSHVSEESRLCIAEFCLYNDNPIRLLFNNFLENEEFKKASICLTYDNLYRILLGYEFKTTDGKIETLKEKFNRRVRDFEIVLSNQYINFDTLKDWLSKVYQLASTDLCEKFIFSDLYRMSQNEFKSFIDLIINKIGLPLIMNDQKQCISLQSEELDVSQFIQFYILQEFLTLVLCGADDKVCPIYDFCIANGGKCDMHGRLLDQSKSTNYEKCQYITFLEVSGLMGVDIQLN